MIERYDGLIRGYAMHKDPLVVEVVGHWTCLGKHGRKKQTTEIKRDVAG